MKGGPVIPRASRPFESPMTLAIRNSRAPVAANPSLVAAGADEAEADTAQRVAAYPSVIDAERHPLYGHGVKHGLYSEPRETDSVTPHAERQGGRHVDQEFVSRESLRQSRLSRWQEQR